jgi:hypothetical protein
METVHIPVGGESEVIQAKVEIERHGHPVEVVTVEFRGTVDRPQLAAKIATLFELEAAEIAAELEEPECLHPEHHHGKLKLTCVDLHFETESKKHHFPGSSTWERVHLWGCKKFKVAENACANLELRLGGPKGPVLNESNPIDHRGGCTEVWMVKPGPEKNG